MGFGPPPRPYPHPLMTHVRFTTSIASADDWAFAVGQVVLVGAVWGAEEIPASSAAAFLASGIVEPVGSESEAAAVDPAEERAVMPTAKPRRRGA